MSLVEQMIFALFKQRGHTVKDCIAYYAIFMQTKINSTYDTSVRPCKFCPCSICKIAQISSLLPIESYYCMLIRTSAEGELGRQSPTRFPTPLSLVAK